MSDFGEKKLTHQEIMDARAWYSVQTYSGMENVVKKNLERRIESMNLTEFFDDILVPEEVRYEKKKNGEMKAISEKPFAGYVFLYMTVTDETWFMVRNTPMVTGFLGSSGGGAKPVPIPEEEMVPIFKMCGLKTTKKLDYEVGDKVEVVNGAFAGQFGTVETIDIERKKLTIIVDFFGRQTPAELEFNEVRKC